MSEFSIVIKAPGLDGATSGIAKLEDTLDATAVAAAKTSAAATSMATAISTGAREGATSIDKVRQAATATAGAIEHAKQAVGDYAALAAVATKINPLGVDAATAAKFDAAVAAGTANLKREQQVLEAIRGPMRQYNADLDALDRLYQKDAISAREYADEVDKLIAKQGTMHGPVQQQTQQEAGGFTSLGGISAGLGTALGVAGGVAAIAAVGSEVMSLVHSIRELEDVSIRASNAAQKFSDATHSTSEVLSEQLDLADQLHASLHDTMELYDKVSDGSEGVSLSHREQISLTKALGEAVQLEGKSVGEGANLMAKFSYAMTTGTIEGRALTRIMREVPTIASLWVESFHVSRNELVELVKTGKITVADLVASIANGGDEIGQKFAANIRGTNEQAAENLKTRVKLALSDPGIFHAPSVSSINEQSMDQPMFNENEGAGSALETVQKMLSTIDDVKAAAERADAAFTHWLVNDGIKHAVTDLKALASVTESYVDQLGRQAGILSDPWGNNDKGFGAKVAEVTKITGPVAAARVELANLQSQMVKNEITGEAYRQKYDALMTTINDGRLPDAIKIWEALGNPVKEYTLQLGGLNALWRAGSIDAHQYNVELGKIAAAYASAKPFDYAQHHAEDTNKIGPRNIGGIQVSQGAEAGGADTGAADQVAAYSRITAAAKAMRDATATNGAGDMFAAQNADALKEQFDVMTQGAAAQVEYERQMKAIQDPLTANSLSEREIAIRVRAATDARDAANQTLHGTRAVIESITGPQEKYERQLEDLAQAYHDTDIGAVQYAHAVDQARLAQLGVSNEGKTFSGGIEKAWLKMKIDAESFGATVANQLVGDVDKLNDALVTAANGGEVAWGSMIDSMIQDLEKLLLKQLEVMAITAIINSFAPGAGSAAAPALASVLPGAATGADWTVGGSGGTDSKIAQFKVTPGERITVTTPGQYQHAPAANGNAQPAAAAPAPVFKIVNVFDKSAIHDAMSDANGAQITLNHMRQNQPAIRGNNRR